MNKLNNGKLLLILFLCITFILKLFFIFIYVGPEPSFLAPDESTYSSLIFWISQGNTPRTFPLIDGDLFFTSFTTSFPSVLFVNLGLEQLFAARLVSIIYSILSVYILYKILLRLLEILSSDNNFKEKKLKILFIIIFIFTYFPSAFVWGALALRESANFFFLLLVFYSFMSYIQKFQIKFLFIFVVSLTLLYFTRPEFLLILSVSFLVLIFQIRKNYYFVLISTLPILIFIISSQVEKKLYTESDFIFSLNKGNVVNNTIIREIKKVTAPSSITMDFSPDNEVVNEKQSIPNYTVDKFNKIAYFFEEMRLNKRKGAESAFPIYKCPEIIINLVDQLYICPFYNFPKQLIDVIVFPVKISKEQSWYKNLAALENIIFNLLLISSLLLFFWWKTNRQLIRIFIQMCISLIFVTLSVFAMIEGNFGTSYRHKMILLSPVLILLYIGLVNFKKIKEKI